MYVVLAISANEYPIITKNDWQNFSLITLLKCHEVSHDNHVFVTQAPEPHLLPLVHARVYLVMAIKQVRPEVVHTTYHLV